MLSSTPTLTRVLPRLLLDIVDEKFEVKFKNWPIMSYGPEGDASGNDNDDVKKPREMEVDSHGHGSSFPRNSGPFNLPFNHELEARNRARPHFDSTFIRTNSIIAREEGWTRNGRKYDGYGPGSNYLLWLNGSDGRQVNEAPRSSQSTRNQKINEFSSKEAIRPAMHQEHTIPWNKLASNYKFVRDNPHFTPRATGLWPRHRPSQQEDLKYFERTFAQTIRLFADTERKKYDVDLQPSADGFIFPDGLLEIYKEVKDVHLDEVPNKRNQQLLYWEQNASTWDLLPEKPPRLYYSDPYQSHLASVIEVLILDNHLSPLLILGRNPKTPIRSLITMGQTWNLGFSRIMHSALFSYVFINLCTAAGVLDDGRYLETCAYKQLVWMMECDRCVPAIGRMYERYVATVERDPMWNRPMLHQNYKALKGYMKLCFAILYRYDLVLRECGVDPDWEEEIRNILSRMGGAW